MLCAEQIALIKATVPLLESGGEALTNHFYKLLLSEHPEVRPLFNQAHQASGEQPRALANGVLMYARHIDRLDALGPLVAQIINKHVALQVLPEHYPLVGNCLLRAIREVLSEAIATDAVIDAWAAAYQQLADLLIGQEEHLYQAKAEAPGGWRGARPFRIARKVKESEEITSFHLQAEDGGPLMEFLPTRCPLPATVASIASASSASPAAWSPMRCTTCRRARSSSCSRRQASSPSRPGTSRWC